MFWETSHFPRFLVPRQLQNGQVSETKPFTTFSSKTARIFLTKEEKLLLMRYSSTDGDSCG